MGCRKQQLLSLGLVFAGVAVLASKAWAASTITAIDFTGTQDPHQLTIQADGPISVTQQTSEQDRQVILEVANATLPRSLARRIDTSSFEGNITLISPYQVEGRPDTVRIVIQLREPGGATLTEQGNSATVLIPRGTGGAMAEQSPLRRDEPPALGARNGAPDTAAPTGPKSTEQQLDSFIQSRGTQSFTGRPITLQVRDVEAQDVFRLIAEASGFNIVLGEDVKGEVTLSLVDVPWDQALDVVLRTLHLGAERNNNILRVVTLKNLTDEKLAELAARRASQASAPRITRIFPISFANLTELAAIISRFASSTPGTGGAAAPAAGGGAGGAAGAPATGAPAAGSPGELDTTPIVQVDNRTNSIIVRDLPDNLERMQKLIALLDTQTPQVMIEAKVVEASESFSKSMTGNLGITGQHGLAGYGTNQVAAAFSGGNFIDPLIGQPGVFTTGAALGEATANAGSIAFSPSLAFVSGFRLNAVLNMGESESQVRVVSAPKTVVLNKEAARIVQGTPVLVPGTSFVEGVGNVPTTSVVTANLSLDVRPTVTNEGSVLMSLTVSRDVPIPLLGGAKGSVAVGTRNMNTIVLVESGSTLVIGGIYSMTSDNSESGFPFLRRIPILGAFFGSETASTNRSELFIFITPRILNPKEAGLSG